MDYSGVAKQAAYIYCCVPFEGFTMATALWCTGLDPEFARIKVIQHQAMMYAKGIRGYEIEQTSDTTNIVERAKILSCFAKRVPKNVLKHGLPTDDELGLRPSAALMDICRLAGFPLEFLAHSSKPKYIQVQQYTKLFEAKKISALTRTSAQKCNRIMEPQFATRTGESTRFSISSVEIERAGEDDVSLLTSLRQQSSESSDSMSISTHPGSSSAPSMASQTSKNKVSSSFSSKVNSKTTRMTSKQSSRAHGNDECWQLCRDTAHILGTQLYAKVKDRTLPLLKFKNENDIAAFINEGFECHDLISGREIKNGAAKGLVGKPAPKNGRHTEVPEDDIEDLISLMFTALTIDQSNCAPNRLRRRQQTSIIGNIINSKRQKDGKLDISDTAFFYNHIAKVLDVKCDLAFTDKREMLRLLWLTYEQQKKHYINWEENLIKQGFGRAPRDANERARNGNVVFFDGALGRMLHIDEMGFHWDGAKNGIGGRVEAMYSNPMVPDAGEASQKSSDKVSILFGATYAGTAMPPLLVFPSKAKAPKMKKSMLDHLHQIEGMFGYSDLKKRKFNCVIGE